MKSQSHIPPSRQHITILLPAVGLPEVRLRAAKRPRPFPRLRLPTSLTGSDQGRPTPSPAAPFLLPFPWRSHTPWPFHLPLAPADWPAPSRHGTFASCARPRLAPAQPRPSQRACRAPNSKTRAERRSGNRFPGRRVAGAGSRATSRVPHPHPGPGRGSGSWWPGTPSPTTSLAAATIPASSGGRGERSGKGALKRSGGGGQSSACKEGGGGGPVNGDQY